MYGILSLRLYFNNNEESFSNKDIQTIHDQILPKIVNCMLNEELPINVRYECSWILLNFTHASSAPLLLEVRVLKGIESILVSADTDKCFIEHVFWIIANIVSEAPDSNFIVLNSIKIFEIIGVYLRGETRKDSQFVRILIWTVNNLLIFVPREERQKYSDILIGVLDTFQYCLTDKDITLNALKIIQRFAIVNDLAELLISLNVIDIMLASYECFQEHENVVLMLNILAELASGPNELSSKVLTDKVLEFAFTNLQKINSFISKCKIGAYVQDPISNILVETVNFTVIAKELFFLLSNIVCCGQEYNLLVVNEESIPVIINIFQGIEDQKVRFEILFTIYNSFSTGNNYTKSIIVKHNMHYLFADILPQTNVPMMKKNILLLVLQAFKEFLDFGEIISNKNNPIKINMENISIPEIIEALQMHKDEEIYELANAIIRKFWDSEEKLYTGPEDFSHFK